MKDFKELAATELKDNVFDLIGKQWMLVTAGNKDKFNTMTASWGAMGILFNKPVAITLSVHSAILLSFWKQKRNSH